LLKQELVAKNKLQTADNKVVPINTLGKDIANRGNEKSREKGFGENLLTRY